MKEEYLDLEVEIIEFFCNDILTDSDPVLGDNEGEGL